MFLASESVEECKSEYCLQDDGEITSDEKSDSDDDGDEQCEDQPNDGGNERSLNSLLEQIRLGKRAENPCQ